MDVSFPLITSMFSLLNLSEGNSFPCTLVLFFFFPSATMAAAALLAVAAITHRSCSSWAISNNVILLTREFVYLTTALVFIPTYSDGQ